ncbi:MAG: hypothetical protein ACYS74_14115 [Planctomycetota bacterium]|jgi:hypothetical protein
MEPVVTYGQLFFGWLLQTTLIASVVICLILLIQKALGGKLAGALGTHGVALGAFEPRQSVQSNPFVGSAGSTAATI